MEQAWRNPDLPDQIPGSDSTKTLQVQSSTIPGGKEYMKRHNHLAVGRPVTNKQNAQPTRGCDH